MNYKYLFLIVSLLIAALLVILWKLTRVAPYQELTQEQSKSVSVSNSLSDLFVGFHTIGSITIRGECCGAHFIADDVPRRPTETCGSLQDGLDAWSILLPRLKAYSDANVWRVSDGTAVADLLKVRIGDLRVRVLDSEEAVAAVLATKEVESFYSNNGIRDASTMIGIVPYDPDSLHRSAWHVRDVTVAEAFDSAVKKYPGVWVYRECVGEKQKLVNVRTRIF